MSGVGPMADRSPEESRRRLSVARRSIVTPRWHAAVLGALVVGWLVLVVGNRVADHFNPGLAELAALLGLAAATLIAVWGLAAEREFDRRTSERREPPGS